MMLQFKVVSADMALKEELESVKFKLSDASLTLLPEYKERLRVLHELNYTDGAGIVRLKVG